MPGTSLGFHSAINTAASKSPTATVSSSLSRPSSSALPAPSKSSAVTCAMPVLKGFLPMLFYSCLTGFVAIAYNYMTFEDMPMVSVIAAGVAALALVLANDPATWYNMALFFYIGLEVRVLDFILAFIGTQDDPALSPNVTTPGIPNAGDVRDRTLAWVAFVVIIVHLVPFLVVNRRGLLAILAFAGAAVNTAVCGYLKLPAPATGAFHEEFTLLMLSSSLGLLALTLFTIRMKCEDCSILTHLGRTIREGGWIYFAPYEM